MDRTAGKEENPRRAAFHLDMRTIKGLLTRDSICRKIRRWKLLDRIEMQSMLLKTLKFRKYNFRLYSDPHSSKAIQATITQAITTDAIRQNEKKTVTCDVYTTDRLHETKYHSPQHIARNSEFISALYTEPNWDADETSAITLLNAAFPHTTELLCAFEGRIVAAGGAIYKAVRGMSSISDIDFFFIDPQVERSATSDDYDRLLVDVISFLTEKLFTRHHQEDGSNQHPCIFVTRNEFVTTVHFSFYDNSEAKYQFIHRIYPSVESILGGFDIGPAMMAYTGRRIVATELGAWSVFSKCLIVDVSRRSTSFEHRLKKYARTCHVIFPGLAADTFPVQCVGWKSVEDVSRLIEDTISDYGYQMESRSGYYKRKAEQDYRILGAPVQTTEPKLTLIKRVPDESKEDVMDRIVSLAADYGYSLENFDESCLVSDYVRDSSHEDVSLEDLTKILSDLAYAHGYKFDMGSYLQAMTDEDSRDRYSKYTSQYSKYSYLDARVKIIKLPRLSIKCRFIESLLMHSQWNIAPRHPNKKAHDKPVAGEHSDYENNPVWPIYLGEMNCTLIVQGKLSTVVSILCLKKSSTDLSVVYDRGERCSKAVSVLQGCIVDIDKIGTKTIADIVRESLQVTNFGNLVEGYGTKCSEIFVGRMSKTLASVNSRAKAYFAEFAPEVIHLSDKTNTRFDVVDEYGNPLDSENTYCYPTSEMNDYIKTIIPVLLERLESGIQTLKANLSRIKWITTNPGRQWTSSINPIILDPREWYGEYYKRFTIGNEETETILRCIRKYRKTSLSILDRPIFDLILRTIVWDDSLL